MFVYFQTVAPENAHTRLFAPASTRGIRYVTLNLGTYDSRQFTLQWSKVYKAFEKYLIYSLAKLQNFLEQFLRVLESVSTFIRQNQNFSTLSYSSVPNKCVVQIRV